MTSVPFELEQVDFGILIPGIPLPEKSQKECGLRLGSNCSKHCWCYTLLISACCTNDVVQFNPSLNLEIK